MHIGRMANQLYKEIQKQYRYHRVKIKLEFIRYIPATQRFLFRVFLQPGTKLQGVLRRAEDIRLAMHLAMFYPFVEGRNLFLAVAVREKMMNSLQAMLDDLDSCGEQEDLPVALGYTITGNAAYVNVAEMPHAMYVGATNSGKSCGLSALIISLLSKQQVSKVNFLLFDIGGNTLGKFDGVPHLSHSIVRDVETGIYVIDALYQEMERRIQGGEEQVRSLPAIVCVMDEFVSFIDRTHEQADGSVVEKQISNLLRRGRKAKIHMIIATQDPKAKSMQVDINNITTRIAFKCAKYQTSINVLNSGGAEKLPGKGAMLYISANRETPLYIQGAYMPPDEMQRFVSAICSKQYDMDSKFIIPEVCTEAEPEGAAASDGMLKRQVITKEQKEFAEVVIWALGRDRLTISGLKSQFSMGNRARDIMKELCQAGIVSEPLGNLPRTVLIASMEELPQKILAHLLACGFSEEDIAARFRARNCKDGLVIHEDNDALLE